MAKIKPPKIRHHPVLIDWLGLMMEEYDPSNRQSWNDEVTTQVMLEYCTNELVEGGGREVGRKYVIMEMDSEMIHFLFMF